MAKTHTILNVRVDYDTMDRLDALAEAREMNRSDLVRALLEYGIDALEQGELDVSVSVRQVVVEAGPHK